MVPEGIFILYLPSCSGSTRRDLGTGTSNLLELEVDTGAATLRRGAELVVEVGSSLLRSLFVICLTCLTCLCFNCFLCIIGLGISSIKDKKKLP